ncbi:MAG: gamma-glutamyltransferase [Phycisphaeraceae bacterium]|nr:MAG: gamma-glutamyltransferase [Phycisphaeraceae bacterium]
MGRVIWSLVISITLAGLSGCSTSPRSGGVVAADHRLASEAGAEILSRGGNAVDAAVATALALSVVRPDSCGLGGGGFMVIHLEGEEGRGPVDTTINFRETCPAAIGPDTYEAWDAPEASRFGGRAVAVPGSVAGLLYALDRYGSLDREDVFAPAIRLAEDGFAADEHHVQAARDVARRFEEHPDWTRRFGFVWSRLMRSGRVEVGETIRNPEQAWALRLIAKRGADAFYKGQIAESIVRAAARDGGVLTKNDLASYTVTETPPIRLAWRDKTLLVMPPPSSGGVAIAQTFGLVDRLGVSLPETGWPDAANAHLLAEIFKHAFADRSRYMADPAFADVPVDKMLDARALDRVAEQIDPAHTKPIDTYGVAPIPNDSGTSHFCVVDGRGNAVACTQTINLEFGSLVTVDGFGFCLNDEMDDFTTVRGKANAFGLRQSDTNLPHPGQRPLSSMSPTIVLDADGRVFALAGASGGPRIITGTAQALLRVLLADASATQAVRAPRLHHQWLPDKLYLETWPDPGAPEPLGAGLVKRGQTLTERRDDGVVQLIRRDARGGWQAACDPRKGGRPAWEE